MKFRKVVSLFAAAALAVSSFAGLATTASAAGEAYAEWNLGTTVKADVNVTEYAIATTGDLVVAPTLTANSANVKQFDLDANTTLTWNGLQNSYSIPASTRGYAIKMGSSPVITLKTNLSQNPAYESYDLLVVHTNLDKSETALQFLYDGANTEIDTINAAKYTISNYSKEGLTNEEITIKKKTSESTLLYVGIKYNPASTTEPEEPGETDEPSEPTAKTNVSVDLTNLSTKSILTSDEMTKGDNGYYPTFSFGLDAEGKRVDATSTDAVIAFTNARYHSEQHGINYGSMTVPVSGTSEIKIGTCAWGSDVIVKDASGNTVATANSNTGACYHNNTTDNVITMYYKTDAATTLTITGGSYIPFVSVKAIDASEIPNDAKITFDASASGAEGTAPAEIVAEIGSEVTIPRNTSLYVAGKTLTAWTDGTNNYAPGSKLVASADVKLTPVFTENTVKLGEGAATVDFTFRRDSGAITYSSQGNSAILVSQAVINGTSIDVKADVDTSNGKFANGSWNDWAQANTGTKFTVPVVEGSIVTVGGLYSEEGKYTIGGVEKTGSNKSETITGAETCDIIVGSPNGGYWRGFTVTYPQVSGATPTPEPTLEPYTATWYFNTDASETVPAINSQGAGSDAAYAVTDTAGTSRTLLYNTANGKLNNQSRGDYAQCNPGTVFKIPSYQGMEITWNTDNYNGFTVDGTSYKTSYIYTGSENQIVLTSAGTWLRYVTVKPVAVYTISGKMTGAESLESGKLTFTGQSTGYVYTTNVSNGAYSIVLPADTYSIVLSDCAYTSTTTTYTASANDSAADIVCAAASYQTVTGTIVNAPAEAFTLTFTGSNNTATATIAAGATSYSVELISDTYTVASSTGVLSPISMQSFLVTNTAAVKNLYYPETIPAATSSTVTVYKDQPVSGANYHTISDAVTGVVNGKISNPTIVLKSGEIYQEQVVIDYPNVTLKTDGDAKATITWYYGIGYTYYSLNAAGMYDKDRAMTKTDRLTVSPWRWGGTVHVKSNADGFKAENIIFENSFNQRYTEEEVADGVMYNGLEDIRVDRTNPTVAADSSEATERAAAIVFENDPQGCELYNCEFIGSQDTFFTSGSIYVKDCAITGNTDYIFGGGSVVFDNCDLIWGGYSGKTKGGQITASSTNGTTDAGYIFRNCTVKNSDVEGRTFAKGGFGRNWGNYATNDAGEITAIKAHAFFFNTVNETGIEIGGWSDMGGDGVAKNIVDLHVYDFTAPTAYDSAEYNVTAIDFEAAKAKYENVIDILGFTPEKMATAVTTKEALEGVEDSETGDYVYGVVTTITAGSGETINTIKWTVKDAEDATYTFDTNGTVDENTTSVSLGTFPVITGGNATVTMLFHADQGTYNVLSQAE